MEPIQLSGDQLKSLQAAIPFQRPAGELTGEPPISPLVEPPEAQADCSTNEEPFDPEPYRKKFRKKFGGDVVQGTGSGYDRDILADPPPTSIDDVSPL